MRNITNLLFVLYVLFMTVAYSLDNLFQGLRLGQVMYLTRFRIGVMIGMYLLCLGILISKWKKNSSLDVWLNKQDILLFLFYLSVTISLLWSVDKTETIRGSYGLFYMILFYVLITVILRKKAAFLYMRYYFLVAPLLYLIISSIIFMKYGAMRRYSHSNFDLGAIGNFIASSATMALPFLYGIILEGQKKKTVPFAILGLVSVLLVILMTESRSSLGAGVIMTVTYFSVIVYISKRIKGRYFVFVVFLCLTSVSLATVFKETLNRFRERVEEVQEISELDRYQLSIISLAMIKEKPILGYGYGTYGLVCAERYGFYNRRGGFAHPHNFIAEIWTGAGVFGLLTFGCLLICLGRRFMCLVLERKVGLDKEGLFIIGIFVSLIGMLSEGLFRGLLMNQSFYFLLALASVASRRTRSF